jgi:hypothetical protein
VWAWFDRRRRGVIAVVVAVALLAPVAIAATLVSGYDRTEVDLHDGGIWVVRNNEGFAGRVSTEIQTIDVSFATISTSDDVLQVGPQVLVTDTKGGAVGVIDVAQGAMTKDRGAFPAKSVVTMGGGGDAGDVRAVPPNALAIAPDGRAWVAPASGIARVQAKQDKPTVKLGAGAVGVVDNRGGAHVYDPKSHRVLGVGADGTESKGDEVEVAQPAITSVGTKVVVLDQAKRRLVLPNGKTVDLSGKGDTVALQQPGPSGDDVVVATDQALLRVDLGSGSVESVWSDARGKPSRPAVVNGCAHGAWSGSRAQSVRACQGEKVEVTADRLMESFSARSNLVFRTNRGRVLINDVTTGANLLFTPDDPKVVDDWTQAESDDEKEQETKKFVNQEHKECQATPTAPVMGNPPPQVGTRAGRPVVVPVLDVVGLRADPCDVVNVVVSAPPDKSVATVAVVDGGSALQITPGAGSGREFSVPFELQGRAPTPAIGSISVVVYGENENLPPVPEPDTTSLVLGPKRHDVVHDVLLNDVDPEGDPLTLVRAWKDKDAGDVEVRFQPTGSIRVSAGSNAQGEMKIHYEVQDDRGSAPVQSELVVSVTPKTDNTPPKARPDRVDTVVGKPVTIDLLANDTDANGDDLTVASIDAPPQVGAVQALAGSGKVTFTPTSADGSPYFFPYEVSDGEPGKPVRGMVRVQVEPAGAGHAPVAVRDDVAARGGGVALVDLTANDTDVDGDPIAVTKVTPSDPGSKVGIELLDMHVVRVNAPAGFSRAESFNYEITDGDPSHVSTGVLVVRPILADGSNLPPVTQDDEVTLRAGTASTVAVLANDVDPEGEHLTLVPELRKDQVPAGTAIQAFVVKDQIHVVASADAKGRFRVGYSAKDAEFSEDGVITVDVVAADQTNRKPRDPEIEGRVRAGTKTPIPVPLVGLDPDGDAVALAGLVSAPRLGSVTFDGGDLVYTAPPRTSGVDEFRYRLDDGRDGGVTEAVARVVIVDDASANTAPTAVLDAVEVARGGSRVIDVIGNDTDAEGDEISLLTDGVDKPSDPQRGSISIEQGRIVYRQDGNVSANDASAPAGVPDGFTYGIRDAKGLTARGTVAITIRETVESTPPIARDDLLGAEAPGGGNEVDVAKNDYDPDDPTATLLVSIPDKDRVEQETGATITLDGSVVNIKVAAGTPRSVVLPYTVTDAAGFTARALVVLPVLADIPPVAVNDKAKVEAKQFVDVPVLANDYDAEAGFKKGVGVSLVEVTNASGGQAIVDGDRVRFTADADAKGSGSFSYAIEDKGGNRTWGRADIEITGNNFTPTLADTTATVSAGGTTQVDLSTLADDENPSDVPRLTFSGPTGITPKVKASLEGSRKQTLVITAEADAKGETAALGVTVRDPAAAEGTGTITVSVSAFEGRPPTALDDADETNQGVAVTRNVVGNDDAGDKGPLTVVGTPQVDGSSGTVSNAGGELKFQPNPDFYGIANITYTAEDATKEVERQTSAVWRVTVIGRPAPPVAPSGVPGNHEVALSWTKPDPRGAEITGYDVETRPATRVENAPGNTFVFTGLDNDTAYQFRVRGRNKATEGAAPKDNWSEWSAPYTPDTTPGAPGAPTPTFGDRQIQLRWTAAPTDGSAVTSQQLQVSSSEGTQVKELGAATQDTVTGLTNGVTYTFRVRAKNKKDWGDWGPLSDAASEGATPAGTPLAPVDVSSTPADQQSAGGAVDIAWRWTREEHGNGAEATSFDVAATDSGGRRVQTQSVAGSARAYKMTGLTNGTTYTFSIVAHTKVTTPSPAGQATARPSKKPNQVSGTPAATNGDGTSRVTFGAPASDGSGPGDGGEPENLSYRVTSSGGTTATGSGSPIDIAVANGGTYTLSIVACNSVGCGPERTVSNVRPFGNPGTPSVSASVSDRHIAWSWGVPDGNGRAITHYELTLDGTLISGNFTGTSYSGDYGYSESHVLSVVAVNEEGRKSSAGAANPTPRTADPPRSVTISKGGSAKGQTTPSGTRCSSDSCAYIRVQTSGFSGNRAVDCWGSDGGWSSYWKYTTASSDSQVCFFGYPGQQVYVLVDGVQSNTLTW